MARKQVFIDDVYRIADELKAEGQSPSSTKIYQRLQCGSLTTISKYLRMWEDSQAHAAAESATQLPEALDRQAQRLMRAFWRSANSQAARALEDERRHVEQREAQALADIDAALALADQAETARVQADGERNAALVSMRDLQSAMQVLREQVQTLQADNVALNAEREQLAQALEASEAHREQVEADNEQLRWNLDREAQERKAKATEAADLRRELSASQQDRATLTQLSQDLREQRDSLSSQLTVSTRELKAANQELQAVSRDRQRLASRNADLGERLKTDAAELAETRELLAKKQTILTRLESRLETELANREDQLTQCRDSLQQTQADLRSAERTASELNGRNLAMQEQVRYLNRELAKCQRQLIDRTGSAPSEDIDDPSDD